MEEADALERREQSRGRWMLRILAGASAMVRGHRPFPRHGAGLRSRARSRCHGGHLRRQIATLHTPDGLGSLRPAPEWSVWAGPGPRDGTHKAGAVPVRRHRSAACRRLLPVLQQVPAGFAQRVPADAISLTALVALRAPSDVFGGAAQWCSARCTRCRCGHGETFLSNLMSIRRDATAFLSRPGAHGRAGTSHTAGRQQPVPRSRPGG